MYTLRTIQNKQEYNRNIGNSYAVVHRELDYECFCETFRITFGVNHVADSDETSDNYTKETYAFVIPDDSLNPIPLYKGQKAFIMTENGKTFDNLTYK